MESKFSQTIDEIIFETNDKINAISSELRLIRFSQMSESEKEEKYEILRKEFESILMMEKTRVENLLKEPDFTNC